MDPKGLPSDVEYEIKITSLGNSFKKAFRWLKLFR